MKYRNKKTGAVIEIRSALSGKDWEAVKDRPSTSTARKPHKAKEPAE